MNRKHNYVYFVEGDTEQKIIDVLKTNMESIQPGRTIVFNIFQDTITPARLTRLSPGTIVIIVFDTDQVNPNFKLYDSNLKKLKKARNVTDIILIPQCKNFEDEIVFSTTINKIESFFPSESVSKFKADMLKVNDITLSKKLEKHQFDIDKFWSREPSGVYSSIPNNALKIKLKIKGK